MRATIGTRPKYSATDAVELTPAVNLLEQRRITYTLHNYDHDVSGRSYGMEAAQKLNVPPARVFKTLVVEINGGELCVGVIPVANQLNLKRMAGALSAKKAALASPQVVSRATGYVLGGVSPLAQKRGLITLIDRSAEKFSSVFVSGGKRGLDIELAPSDLCQLCSARFEDLC